MKSLLLLIEIDLFEILFDVDFDFKEPKEIDFPIELLNKPTFFNLEIIFDDIVTKRNIFVFCVCVFQVLKLGKQIPCHL